MKVKTVFVICLMASAALLPAATKKPYAPPKKTSPAAVIPVDPQFLSTYIDYQRLVQEINTQLRESGNIHRAVSTYDLQKVAQGKITAMESWAKAHKVPQGYIFNAQKRDFEAPPPSAAKGSKKEK